MNTLFVFLFQLFCLFIFYIYFLVDSAVFINYIYYMNTKLASHNVSQLFQPAEAPQCHSLLFKKKT